MTDLMFSQDSLVWKKKVHHFTCETTLSTAEKHGCMALNYSGFASF